MEDSSFRGDIERFNKMYRLPLNLDSPTLLPADRLKDFRDILFEEVKEADDIREKYEGYQKLQPEGITRDQRLDVLTDVADWLGDLMVYARSEAMRWGIPLEGILKIIMESNFSKQGRDGNPIYDSRGKVMKGPDYWKPEPRIREFLDKITE